MQTKLVLKKSYLIALILNILVIIFFNFYGLYFQKFNQLERVYLYNAPIYLEFDPKEPEKDLLIRRDIFITEMNDAIFEDQSCFYHDNLSPTFNFKLFHNKGLKLQDRDTYLIHVKLKNAKQQEKCKKKIEEKLEAINSTYLKLRISDNEEVIKFYKKINVPERNYYRNLIVLEYLKSLKLDNKIKLLSERDLYKNNLIMFNFSLFIILTFLTIILFNITKIKYIILKIIRF